MNTKASLGVVAQLLCIALAAVTIPARGASAEEPAGFLLRSRTHLMRESPPFEATVDQLVFRDGTIVISGDNPVLGVSSYERRKASPERLRELYLEIRRDRVGEQEGQCVDVDSGFDEDRRTITLFASGPHGHSYTTGSAFAESCNAETVRFSFFLGDWILAAPLVDGRGQVVVED